MRLCFEKSNPQTITQNLDKIPIWQYCPHVSSGGVAQLVEQWNHNPLAGGSSPSAATTYCKRRRFLSTPLRVVMIQFYVLNNSFYLLSISAGRAIIKWWKRIFGKNQLTFRRAYHPGVVVSNNDFRTFRKIKISWIFRKGSIN